MYKLCPFCGVEDGDHDEGVPFLHGEEVDMGRHAVVCGNCGGMGGIRDTPEKATEAWNNRAIIQQ
jgi:Lar family restriction alleviation protein